MPIYLGEPTEPPTPSPWTELLIMAGPLGLSMVLFVLLTRGTDPSHNWAWVNPNSRTVYITAPLDAEVCIHDICRTTSEWLRLATETK